MNIILIYNFYRPCDPHFETKLDGCLAVAELADELSTVFGTQGEALTLYIKFLMDMKQLSRELPHDAPHTGKYPQKTKNKTLFILHSLILTW